MPTAAGLQADIVERGNVDVALIVERQRHQRIGNARVHQCVGGRHAHHAVVRALVEHRQIWKYWQKTPRKQKTPPVDGAFV